MDYALHAQDAQARTGARTKRTRAKRAHAYTHARAQARIMRTREAERLLPYYRKKKMLFHWIIASDQTKHKHMEDAKRCK